MRSSYAALAVIVTVALVGAAAVLVYDGLDHGSDDGYESGKLLVTVNGETFTATFADNEAAESFRALLPMTLKMTDLHYNEKYAYIDGNLPTAAAAVGTISNGDLMLYGTNCVVLFYQTFTTQESYTALAHIDAPLALAAALGAGEVTVTFGVS